MTSEMHIDAGVPVRNGRGTADMTNVCQLLTEVLAELKHIRNAIGTTSRSSAELSENAKGGVQVSVKTYVDSPPMDDACIEAVASFRTLKQKIERGLMEGWQTTVDMLQEKEP